MSMMITQIFGKGTAAEQSMRLCVDNRYDIQKIAKSISEASRYTEYDSIPYHDAHDVLKNSVHDCVEQMIVKISRQFQLEGVE